MVGPSLNSYNLTLKPNAASATIKFLCSYGGKILPRYPDGKLRYHGGQTRVLAVDRSISFSELMVKLGEMCGMSVTLRCQLPTEDLDALVSITSDEDLANLIEEYDRAASPSSAVKIRAFLYPPKSAKKISPPPSSAAASSPRLTYSVASSSRFPPPDRCIHQIAKPVLYPPHPPPHPHPHHHNPAPHHHNPAAGKVAHYGYGNPSRIYLIHNGNHWQ